MDDFDVAKLVLPADEGIDEDMGGGSAAMEVDPVAAADVRHGLVGGHDAGHWEPPGRCIVSILAQKGVWAPNDGAH
ncbi:MAG: hypothetical protein Kow0010_13930 [Dehalococcoidia bacterium]